MIRNFLFHRVNPVREKLWDPMSVELFNRCVKYIAGKYQVVLFEELMESGKVNPKTEYATIMFDDGFKDNIDYAAPILKKHNCKASFYVVTNCIDKNIPTWTYILEYLFEHTGVSKVDMNFDFLPFELKVASLASKDLRIKFVAKLKPVLKKLSHKQRTIVLQHIENKFNDVQLPKIMMNWKEINQLQADGHYIGSHTTSHAMLGTMDGEVEIKNELKNSAERIKEQTGKFPFSISYPVGSFNQVTKRISSEVGYKAGLAVKQNIFNPMEVDRFEIPRIELYNEPWWKTKLRITHSLEKIKTVIGYK